MSADDGRLGLPPVFTTLLDSVLGRLTRLDVLDAGRFAAGPFDAGFCAFFGFVFELRLRPLRWVVSVPF